MKLSTSSDGSGLVWLPPFHSVVQVSIDGVVTTTGFTVSDRGLQFSPIPPVGYAIEVTLNEHQQHQIVVAPTYTKRVDVASATVSYIGEAQAGSSESDPVWRIQKSVSNAEGDLNIFFANGSDNFNNIWTNRVGLTYV